MGRCCCPVLPGRSSLERACSCCSVAAGDGRARFGGRPCRDRRRYVPAGSHDLSAGGHRCTRNRPDVRQSSWRDLAVRGCGARSIDRSYWKSRGSLQGRGARTRTTSTARSGCARSKARLPRSMSGWFAKDGRSGSGLRQPAASRRRKLTHARTGADCGADVSRNRLTSEDGISVARDLWAAVASRVIRIGHASNYSASTPTCRRDARSRPSLRCGL